MKATNLRKNLFKVLDRAAKTGKPVEIESKGRRFKIVALGKPDRFANLQKHPDVFSGDLDELIHIEWMTEWRP
jgi:prevent-host-death family protein